MMREAPGAAGDGLETRAVGANGSGEPVVVVAGDLAVDWNLARTRRSRDSTATWSADDQVRACSQHGGAALVGDLLESVADQLRSTGQPAFQVRRMALPPGTAHPADERFHHTFAIWSLFRDGGKLAWRVEEFLGLDPVHAGSPPGASAGESRLDAEDADVVLLDDADLGFRDQTEQWPAAITGEGRPWIVLKMARPVAQGPLWRFLRQRHAERLVVVMTVNDLRLTEVHVSRELSWERTAQDLFWELTHNPRVNALSRCAHVIVSLDTAGTLLLSRSGQGEPPRCLLFFDPREIEGTWNRRYPGGMIGYTSCLTAGIACQLVRAAAEGAAPDLEPGIQAGVMAMRRLHVEGYDAQDPDPSLVQLRFPLAAIAGEVTGKAAPLATADVQDPVRFLRHLGSDEGAPAGGFWTILEVHCTGTLDQVARRIVIEGPDNALQNVPLGRFGALVTADRREIEGFRSVRNLIAEYCRQPANRPLSVAVFGPPGSGKSFGVLQVAKSILPGEIEARSFNLSQFGGPGDLLDALHQVRDVGLSGKVPLVFWDEFDTALNGEALGWLRYFLAPMQDGSFQQGQITHPIGRAIFVFAGGTCKRMADFDRGPEDKGFKGVKGPDFISRLKGYIDIMGPNPLDAGADADPYHLLRRAILLRSILERSAPQLFRRDGGVSKLSVDSGVLRAFLETREYRHGARSIEAIVGMSLLTGKHGFERSCLPAEQQLNLHVDGREFLALAQQLELEGEVLQNLATEAHKLWFERRKQEGYEPGARDDAKKTHPLLVDYAHLDDMYKESNRSTVRTIPKKLAAAGYVMVPSRSDEPALEFPGEDLEQLAAAEHARWLAEKLAAGFTLPQPGETGDLRNPNLVPWDKLPDTVKEINKQLIRDIPTILARAGYAVVKVNPDGRTLSL
jgi:hypothetical protein